jgi:hypothetical protein
MYVYICTYFYINESKCACTVYTIYIHHITYQYIDTYMYMAITGNPASFPYGGSIPAGEFGRTFGVPRTGRGPGEVRHADGVNGATGKSDTSVAFMK